MRRRLRGGAQAEEGGHEVGVPEEGGEAENEASAKEATSESCENGTGVEEIEKER